MKGGVGLDRFVFVSWFRLSWSVWNLDRYGVFSVPGCDLFSMNQMIKQGNQSFTSTDLKVERI